jgi:diadenosine tetraphosphate (Ap4A) HIT family hydrolase
VSAAGAAPGFELDTRLAVDSHLLADGPLSQLRLMDDLRFPWLLLVPRVGGASELADLDAAAQQRLLAEINAAAALLRAWQAFDKLNLGALGNVVRQLHVHLVGRRPGDPAWPGPVWGAGAMQRATLGQRSERLAALRAHLDPGLWRGA